MSISCSWPLGALLAALTLAGCASDTDSTQLLPLTDVNELQPVRPAPAAPAGSESPAPASVAPTPPSAAEAPPTAAVPPPTDTKPPAEAPVTPAARPLYAVATVVSGPDESNMYLRVLDSLEPQSEKLDLSSAREFPGWSDLKVHGGKLFVSSGEAPTVTRYSVNEALELVEEGRLSFASFTDDASMYSQVFVAEDKAYLTLGVNEYVIWNPLTLEITGTIKGPVVAAVGGAEASSALDRGTIVRGGRLYHSINWFDYESYRMAPTSLISVVDIRTDRVVSQIEAPCPYLEPGTMDEAGNLYFSNWVYSPAATWINAQAKACAVRLPAGSDTLDSSWKLDFSAATGGHEAAAMEYLGGGRALLSVFREDNRAFDPSVTDAFDWVFDASWRFYTVDIATQQASEIPELGWHSGGYYASRIDGATFILVPGAGYTSTELFRLSDQGETTRVMSMDGWSTRILKLR